MDCAVSARYMRRGHLILAHSWTFPSCDQQPDSAMPPAARCGRKAESAGCRSTTRKEPHHVRQAFSIDQAGTFSRQAACCAGIARTGRHRPAFVHRGRVADPQRFPAAACGWRIFCAPPCRRKTAARSSRRSRPSWSCCATCSSPASRSTAWANGPHAMPPMPWA